MQIWSIYNVCLDCSQGTGWKHKISAFFVAVKMPPQTAVVYTHLTVSRFLWYNPFIAAFLLLTSSSCHSGDMDHDIPRLSKPQWGEYMVALRAHSQDFIRERRVNKHAGPLHPLGCLMDNAWQIVAVSPPSSPPPLSSWQEKILCLPVFTTQYGWHVWIKCPFWTPIHETCSLKNFCAAAKVAILFQYYSISRSLLGSLQRYP